ncbi:ATP-binding protein [Methanohalophilus sp.]
MDNDDDILAYATGDKGDNVSSKEPVEDFEEYVPDTGDNPDESSFDNALGTITTGIDPLEITEAGARLTGYITSTHRPNVRLGTYVLVPYGDEDLFARVWKLQYLQEFEVDDATELHSRRMLKANNTNEIDYKFLAYLDPLCILSPLKAGLMRRMADRLPRPNTPILPVSEKLKIQTGLNIPTEGIFLGHLSVGGELVRTHASPPTVAYYLRNDYSMGDPLMFRHMLVCGSTGTGKTFLTKNILRQFLASDNQYLVRGKQGRKKNPCLVIMDPQDEYSQLFEDNAEIGYTDEVTFAEEDVLHGGHKDTRTFLASVDGQSYPGKSRAQQMEFTIPFELVRNNSWLISAAELTENQYIGLELLIEDYFNTPANHTYQGFTDFIADEGTRSVYVDSGKIHESSYDAIVRKVKNRSFSKVFDQPAKPITEILDEVFKPGRVSVFPTEYINNSRIRDLITLTLMTIVVDNKLSTSGNDSVKKTPVLLALDEAHRYLSGAMSAHSRRIVSRFADAARQGRKETLGLFLITQDPQDIDDTVLKQINSRIILNLSNDNAINALNVPLEFEKRIPYLRKGQMIIQSPDNSDIVEVTGLHKCVVKHA